MLFNNEKISSRQFGRLLTLELFGMTTLLLPEILCGQVGRDAVTALALGLLLTGVFTALLCMVAKQVQGDLWEDVMGYCGKTFRDIVILIYLVQTILLGSLALCLCGDLIRDILLQNMDVKWLMFSLWLVCVYAAKSGMESRARMSEVLFRHFMILFIVFLLLVGKNVNVERFAPIFITDAKTMVKSGYEVLIIFQGAIFGLFALPYLQEKKSFSASLKKSIIWNGVFCFCLLLAAIGIFGAKAAAAQNWLAVDLMTTASIPGGFIKRLDTFMVTIWIVTLFFLLSGSIYHGRALTQKLLESKHEKNILAAVSLIILLVSLLSKGRANSYYIYMNYMFYVGVPASICILVIIILRGRWKKRKVKSGLLKKEEAYAEK